MSLHPHAAIRALRRELTWLADARSACAQEIALADAPDSIGAETLRRRLAARAAVEMIGQICVEVTEIEDALMILETGFEVEQGQLAFEMPRAAAHA